MIDRVIMYELFDKKIIVLLLLLWNRVVVVFSQETIYATENFQGENLYVLSNI